MGELEGTLSALRTVVESEGMQQLPMNVQSALQRLDDVLEGFDSQSEFQYELLRTVEELKDTLQSIDSFADQLSEKPNALVFPPKATPDPEPRLNP